MTEDRGPQARLPASASGHFDMKVTVLDDYQRAIEGTEAIRRLRQKAEVQVFTEKLATQPALIEALRGSQAIIPIRERTKFSAALLQALPDLEFISQTGNHAYHIDIEAATRAGIIIALAPGGNSTTELAFGLILAVMRRIPQSDQAMRRGEWPMVLGYVLKGKTLGILGLGKIGTEVAAIARAFGMNVIAYDPLISEDDIKQRGAEPVSIQDLYAWSDFISLHLPLNVQTRDMMGRQAFSQMKDGVRIVCAARGGIIDETALIAALDSGKVAGAGLDVFGQEPPGLTPVVSHPRVIATPHVGAQTVEAQTRASEDIAAEVLSALQGKPLRWKVN